MVSWWHIPLACWVGILLGWVVGRLFQEAYWDQKMDELHEFVEKQARALGRKDDLC